jgi:ubiquitin-protein ligase
VTPTAEQLENLEMWNCQYNVDGGRYDGATFRFTINFKDDYPKSAVDVNFESFVFHPRVNASNGHCQV